jgi:hypothetical protein
MHTLVRLAKQAVETYIRRGEVLQPPELTPEMMMRAGVFVSIYKKGELRGCIGTYEPQKANIAEEVIANAISSATRDPRFLRVRPDELEDLDYSIDILTIPQSIPSKDNLDPKKYGVIVESGFKKGLLLPNLAGVNTVEAQIDICRQKGGITPDEPIRLYRFEVRRYI